MSDQPTLPDDVLAPTEETYEPTDIFQWANNLVQYKDELNIDLFFFNKNGITYRTSRSKDLDKQMEPLFIDELLEEVLDGAEKGMTVRAFEEAEAEADVLRWIKTQEHEMELFSDETHEIKRMRGAVARVSHEGMDTFYIIKQLPTA